MEELQFWAKAFPTVGAEGPKGKTLVAAEVLYVGQLSPRQLSQPQVRQCLFMGVNFSCNGPAVSLSQGGNLPL